MTFIKLNIEHDLYIIGIRNSCRILTVYTDTKIIVIYILKLIISYKFSLTIPLFMSAFIILSLL